MNEEVLGLLGIKLEKREEYAIEYIEEILAAYATATDLDFTKFVSGIGVIVKVSTRNSIRRCRDIWSV